MTAAHKITIQNLFRDGYTTAEIASLTGVHRVTVRYHVRPIRIRGPLTDTQRQILVSMANGMSAKEMAQEQGTTLHAVERQRWLMMRKTGCRNSPQMVAWGFKNKYLI